MAVKVKPSATARALRGALVLVLLSCSAAAGAQSDGSLEETYASQCPEHQDTQACNTLREAMEKSAKRTNAPVAQKADVASNPWGGLANLAGTVWKSSDGSVRRYTWQVPDEIMVAELATPQEAMRTVMARQADGRIVATDHVGRTSLITVPRPGVFVQEYEGQLRATHYLSAKAIHGVREDMQQGAWRQTGTIERYPATDAEFEAARRLALAREEAVFARWGVLPKLAGYWSDGNFVWEGFWKSKSFFVLNVYGAAEGAYWQSYRFEEKQGRLEGSDVEGNYYAVALLPGGLFVDGTDDAFFLRSPTQFDFQNGRMRDGVFVPKDSQPSDRNGSFRRLSHAEAVAFRQQRENYVRQKEASKGDSGLFGALAMATGAALAGGNAEMVMGAAMKGAELTTDNEMTRNVLAGQGDQMIASGFDRMAANNALRNGNASGSAGGGSSRQASSALTQLGVGPDAKAAQAGAGRPGYYACNSYNVTTRVLYFSPIVVRPYDDQSWGARLKEDFARFTAEHFPGEYHGGGATCWARRSQAETETSISSSKRSTASMDQTWRDVVDWAAPE